MGSGRRSRVGSHALLAALTLASVLAGCSGHTRVREIAAAPDSFEGKEVRLKGTVGKTMNPPRPQAYMLRDGTGEIMVVTKGRLPAPDSEVEVKGVVRGSVVRGSRWTFDVRVEETERLR